MKISSSSQGLFIGLALITGGLSWFIGDPWPFVVTMVVIGFIFVTAAILSIVEEW